MGALHPAQGDEIHTSEAAIIGSFSANARLAARGGGSSGGSFDTEGRQDAGMDICKASREIQRIG